LDADLREAELKQCPLDGILNHRNTIGYVYWQDDDMWLGYLEEFPDYVTQGVSLNELQENLRDIYEDLTGGKIPGVRHVAELPIA
jgi:predicted RNase H-like HicB family nuclease